MCQDEDLYTGSQDICENKDDWDTGCRAGSDGEENERMVFLNAD